MSYLEYFETLKNNTLTKLNLVGFQNVGDQGLYTLSQALSMTTSLKNLNLCHCNLGDEGVKVLANALLNNQSLQELSLNVNHIGDEGAEYLSKFLLKNSSLRDLYLAVNEIGDLGAEFLAQALLKNTSLLKLWLCGNYKMTIKGEICMRKALFKNPSLEEFDGFLLVQGKQNKHTLEKWRFKIQKRRKKLTVLLGYWVRDLNLLNFIFQLESCFPLYSKTYNP